MRYNDRTNHRFQRKHQELVKKKQQKLGMLQALSTEYCKLGWDDPENKGYDQYKELTRRIGLLQIQLTNMGADVEPAVAGKEAAA